MLGILFIWAAWPVRGLKWIALVLNIAMICATPLWGGHYFVDLVAGFVLALVGLFVANAIVVWIERNSKAKAIGLRRNAELLTAYHRSLRVCFESHEAFAILDEEMSEAG